MALCCFSLWYLTFQVCPCIWESRTSRWGSQTPSSCAPTLVNRAPCAGNRCDSHIYPDVTGSMYEHTRLFWDFSLSFSSIPLDIISFILLKLNFKLKKKEKNGVRVAIPESCHPGPRVFILLLYNGPVQLGACSPLGWTLRSPSTLSSPPPCSAFGFCLWCSWPLSVRNHTSWEVTPGPHDTFVL